MVLGYARVSKGEEQDTHMQETAFRTAGVARTFTEHASGGRWDRPQLHRLLDQLRPGDVVVVWKLDRLSRSLKDLLHIMEHIAQAGAGFRSLTEAIDTTTPAGRMLMQMVGSFAEFRTGHDPRAHAGRARGGPGARSDWRPPAQAGAPAAGRNRPYGVRGAAVPDRRGAGIPGASGDGEPPARGASATRGLHRTSCGGRVKAPGIPAQGMRQRSLSHTYPQEALMVQRARYQG